MKISIETTVKASREVVWNAWVTPEEITQWNFASADWHCPQAEIALQEGGSFSYRLESKDGSAGFDFGGRFILVKPLSKISYELVDGREVTVEFVESNGCIKVIETFEAEDEHSGEQQRQGWLAILENFKQHVESRYR